MKKLVLSVAAVLALSAPAFAGDGTYVSLFGGTNVGGKTTMHDNTGDSLNMDYKAGYVVGSAFGYKTSLGLRIETELAYRGSDVDKVTYHGATESATTGDISVLSTMVNAFYDFNTGTAFTPYVGGGIGIAVPHFSTDDLSYTGDVTFAYQAGAGVQYDLTKKIALDLGYRYFGTTDSNYSLGVKADYTSHAIQMGATYRFY